MLDEATKTQFRDYCEIVKRRRPPWQEAGDELLKLGFTQEELDYILFQCGYTPLQVYAAAKDQLDQGVPADQVYGEFRKYLPELFEGGGVWNE